MPSSRLELLGIAVRRDRDDLGITQDELHRLMLNEAVKFKVNVLAGGPGLIERCLRREVPFNERQLLAHCLKQPLDRYINLPTDPRKVIGMLRSQDSDNNIGSALERSIVFPPEHKQAGVAILSYFSEVVSSKYPDANVKVSIMQNGNTVTLRVETPDGNIEQIEKTLEQYGLVVVGKLPMEKFSDDRELIRELKTRLEITSLELRLRNESFLEQKSSYEKRVGSLEDQVKSLYAIVSIGLNQAVSLSEVIKVISGTTKYDERVAAALETITAALTQNCSHAKGEVLSKAFVDIKENDPSLYEKLRTSLISIPASIMANLATPWIQHIISNLPK